VEIASIVLDTNVYSLALRGEVHSVALLKRANKIMVCPTVLGELYAGFRLGSKERENLQILNRFLDSPRVRVVNITEKTAVHYGQVFKDLRATGAPIPTNDMWIAAVAKEHGLPVATADQHFSKVPGLLVEHIEFEFLGS